jgi:hypothetical protein
MLSFILTTPHFGTPHCYSFDDQLFKLFCVFLCKLTEGATQLDTIFLMKIVAIYREKLEEGSLRIVLSKCNAILEFFLLGLPQSQKLTPSLIWELVVSLSMLCPESGRKHLALLLQSIKDNPSAL